MADNKKKQGYQDDNLINFKQKWEFDYALRQLQIKHPEATKQEAKEALTEAAREISPSEGRKKIMREAGKNLQD